VASAGEDLSTFSLAWNQHTSPGLNSLVKDADINKTVEAVRIARELGFGVTGNFIIDPDFTEADFQRLWDFLDEHQLYRVGFTILTPLPGTYYFEKSKEKIDVFDWSHYDLHHLLWQPRLAGRTLLRALLRIVAAQRAQHRREEEVVAVAQAGESARYSAPGADSGTYTNIDGSAGLLEGDKSPAPESE
jgi:hypothetical protein